MPRPSTLSDRKQTSRGSGNGSRSADGGSSVPVAFISSSGELGGAEGLMLSLVEQLGSSWIRSMIVLGEGPLAAELRDRGLPTEVVQAPSRLALLSAILRVRRLLRAQGVAVIHANGLRAAVVAGLASLGTPMRVIWLKVSCARDGWAARLIASRCDQVVGISNTVNATFRGRARNRVHVVYPGLPDLKVDPKSARKLVAELLDCPPEADVVVVSARLCPPKGQVDLLELAPRLLAERPGLRIALLGGETGAYAGYEAALRKLTADLGIAHAVSFLGHRTERIRSRADVIRFVGGCDLLVAPSRTERGSGWREGFGLAPAEAMAVRTPVVAYRHGSLPEVLGSCAYLVPEGDRDALAEGILRVLSDGGLRQRMVECGAKRVGDLFRLGDMVGAIKRRYRAAAGLEA